MIHSAFARNYVYVLKPVFPPRFDPKMYRWTDHVIRGYWYQFVIFNLSSLSVVSLDFNLPKQEKQKQKQKQNKQTKKNQTTTTKTNKRTKKTNNKKQVYLSDQEPFYFSSPLGHYIWPHVQMFLFLMGSFANL